MKKILACVFILCICITFCFSLSFDSHIGILSGVGVSQDFEKFKVGISIESSFPGYAAGDAYMCEQDEMCSFAEGFKNGCKYFIGLDLSAYYSLFKTSTFSVYSGFDLFAGDETPINCIDAVLKCSLRLERKTGSKSSIFVNINYPVAALTYTKGFEKPLVYIPEHTWLPVLTGWSIGMSFEIQ